jgi:hypothetical protein
MRELVRPERMTHYVNQELAKHRYATILREAHVERLAKVSAEQTPPRWVFLRQLTWARRRAAFGRAVLLPA